MFNPLTSYSFGKIKLNQIKIKNSTDLIIIIATRSPFTAFHDQ